MLRQIYIIDIKAADPIFQEAYIINVLINPREIDDDGSRRLALPSKRERFISRH